MYTIFYSFIFVIGILLGSFFTLSIYRVPKKQDILYTRSYCPKCKHRLEFLDLIPVLSYIFLGGKCRYCKNPIGERYVKIELISGLIYLLFIMSLRIDFLEINIFSIIFIILATFLYSICFIIIGIHIEKNNISKLLSCIFYITALVNIVYVCILKTNVYTYAIFILAIILTIIVILKNRKI